jgi:hypothetical protein
MHRLPRIRRQASRVRHQICGRIRAVARYIQKISLRPYSDSEIWTGWELEGRVGNVEGLISADQLSPEELAKLGVTEFQKIPAEYLESGEFLPRK